MTLSEMRGELFKTIGSSSSSKGNKPKTRVPDSPSPPPPPPPSLESHSAALNSEEEGRKMEEEVNVEQAEREEAVNDDSVEPKIDSGPRHKLESVMIPVQT